MIAFGIFVVLTSVGCCRCRSDATVFAAADTPKPVENRRNAAAVDLPEQWAADMFYRALANFTVREDAVPPLSTACRKQTRSYVRNLKINSYWAVKMYDSWSRYPIGILAGSTHQMGVYEECVDVHRPVQGKYCMAAARLGPVADAVFKLNKKDEQENTDNAWNEILGFVDYQDRYRRDEVKFGVCIPESCAADNLEWSLQKQFDEVFAPNRLQVRVRVDPALCSTDKDVYHPRDTGYYVTRTIMYTMLLACCLCTVYHLIEMTQGNEENKKSVSTFVNWFSIVHNGKKLIKYNRNNNLNIFNGLKTVTMILILFGHVILYKSTHPTLYAMRFEELYKIGPDILLTCMNFVDPFFFISGYLIYVMIKPNFTKRDTSWTQIPKIVFYKYLRMMPSYAAMMLLMAYLIPYLNKGPFWASRMWPEAEKCRKYWWTNFLGISNLLDSKNQCLVVGWYVSCLLQFIVIGTVIIYICAKSRKIGTGLICVLFCVSLVVPFVLTYASRSYGIIRVTIPFLDDPNSSFEFRNLYRPFYMRGIPFFAGLLAAITVEELNKKKIKLSKITIFVWTFIITTVCIFVQYHGARFYDRRRPYNVIEHASYATISHCIWTSMLYWIMVGHFTSGYGPIERVFNNRLCTILGRLSYSVYLVNMPVMMAIEYRDGASSTPSTPMYIDGWIVGAFRSYSAGLMLYLVVEAPFNEIIKIMFLGSKKRMNAENGSGRAERSNSKIENLHVDS